MNSREIIARRTAKEIFGGQVVNLGIGIPMMVPRFIKENQEVIFQCDNGVLGIDMLSGDESKYEYHNRNAAGDRINLHNYGCFFDACTAFGMIGTGKIDVTILGALQVDSHGSMASWSIPGKFTLGMGGAMDLVCGSKKVIVTMEHMAKGEHRIVRDCTLPLTGKCCVDTIITEKCVMKVTDKGLVLRELQKGTGVEEILEGSHAEIIVPDHIGEYCMH